jgi:opacity protein-like surface antigen
MKRIVLLAVVLVFAASVAYAASVKSYQVTGPVLELKDDVIVVQKGTDKWEIARDKATKVTGDLKVGSKVTIQYQMSAQEIEVKDAPKKEAPAKAPAKK